MYFIVGLIAVLSYCAFKIASKVLPLIAAGDRNYTSFTDSCSLNFHKSIAISLVTFTYTGQLKRTYTFYQQTNL